MTKIVINSDWGGFGLSRKAMERYLTIKGIEFEVDVSSSTFGIIRESFYHKGHVGDDKYYISEYDIARDDPALVQVVEELPTEADGNYSALKVVEIPDGVKWIIHEYDGIESIHEKHRVWS